jgi:BASS family bile acid:Na+ symporter
MAEFLPQLQKLSMLVFLVSSMLAMGLTLTLTALITPLRNVRLVSLALALNFVLAPAFAWLLTVVIPLDRGHTIGLLLLGGVAGAPFIPKVVENARGNLALAVALMGLLTLGTILFLPFALPLMIPGLRADPWSIARPLVLLIVLPLAVGMLLKKFASTLAALTAPVLAQIGNAAMLLLFALMVWLNFRALLGVIGSGAIGVALIYFAGLFILGWVLGGPKPEVRGALGIVTTARNFGAALVPAANSFSDPKVTIMIIVGAIVGLVVSFTAAGWLRHRVA